MPTTHPQSQQGYGSLTLIGCATAFLSLYALLPSQATAQGVRGGVFDEETQQAVATAMVVLVDTTGIVAGQALSDSAGLFFIEVDPGIYSVIVNRLGYEPMYITEVALTDPSIVPLEIRLSPDAISLPGLVVEGERRERYLTVNGFYDRQRMGFGHFIEIEESRRLQTFAPTDFVRRFPGVRITGGQVLSARGAWIGGTLEPCMLQIVVDGVYRGINMDEVVTVQDIAAIEVYQGLSNYPAQWHALALGGSMGMEGGGPKDARNKAAKFYRTCGLVVVWTKH